MTEDVAKTKWCPMIREELSCKGSINRWDGEAYEYGEEFSCIASSCMMWRWTITPEVQRANNSQNPCGSIVADGYCGLAGKE